MDDLPNPLKVLTDLLWDWPWIRRAFFVALLGTMFVMGCLNWNWLAAIAIVWGIMESYTAMRVAFFNFWQKK
jgi:hypothetical protein